MAKKVYKEKKEVSFFSELLASQKEYPVGYLIALIAILAFIPFLVHLYVYDPGLDAYDWIQAPASAMDFFLHVKMIWLYVAFGLILFILIFMFVSEQIRPKWDKIFIPLFIYGGLCLISAFASTNMHFSFSGIYEQFESVWMLLGYVLIVYYAFFTVNTEKAIRCLVPWFNLGVTLMSGLGLMQAFGRDPYYMESLQKLFISDPSWIGKIRSAFEKGRTYLSLYNPNYVGFYVVMVVPVLFVLLLHTRRIISKIVYAALIAAQIFILFASQSRAGILVLMVTFILMLIYLRRFFARYWLPFVSVAGIVIVAFIGINVLNQNALLNRMKSMFRVTRTNDDLESIVTGKEDVVFSYKGHEVRFAISGDKSGTDDSSNDASLAEENENRTLAFSVKDETGKDVAYTASGADESYTITDERFPFSFGRADTDKYTGFWVKTPKVEYFDGEAHSSEKTWTFTNSEKDGSYYVIGPSRPKLFKLKKHENGVSFLEDHATIANKRGFIWARTIPLLKKYFFLGSGPDTFVIAFPNDDLVGLMNGQHDGELVTKPHCMYLQIGTQAGVPALAAFLVFFFWYIGSSLKLYWKQDFTELLPKFGIGVLASVLGFLILGLTNDSCIVVSPVLYALAGIGLGINYRLRKQDKRINF